MDNFTITLGETLTASGGTSVTMTKTGSDNATNFYRDLSALGADYEPAITMQTRSTTAQHNGNIFGFSNHKAVAKRAIRETTTGLLRTTSLSFQAAVDPYISDAQLTELRDALLCKLHGADGITFLRTGQFPS